MPDRRADSIVRGVRGLLVFLVLAVGLTNSKAAIGSNETADRVVAIGDVHGDFDDFCLLLRKVGLVDTQNRWTGGKTVVVQTGDLLDRGDKGREAMDLVMRLETEAAKDGGQVLALLGNHEVMNILGDLRYVSPASYAAFADSESEKRRKAAYQEYASWYAQHAEILAAIHQTALPASEEAWMAKHPAGFLEYSEALGPDGSYGKWLRGHATVARIGGVIFLHGGISANLISMKLEQINLQIREEIEEFDNAKQYLISRKLILPYFTIQETAAVVPPDAQGHATLTRVLGFGSWFCMRDDGPLWFRGYDQWGDEEGAQQIEKVLAAYDATHLVVGHTVQKTAHIRSRFAGKVFLIDTGMLSTFWKGGRASALEIRSGHTFNVLYLDGQETVFEEKPLVSAEPRK